MSSETSGKHYLVVDLLRAFYWFDDGLQNFLRTRGWPSVPRTQSMALMNIMSGINRPVDIARNLGISRQAIHVTLAQMQEAGLIELKPDPEDGRGKCVALSEKLQPIRNDARAAIDILTEELSRRLGPEKTSALTRVFEQDWGPAPTFGADKLVSPPEGAPAKIRRRATGSKLGRANPGYRVDSRAATETTSESE